VPAFIKELKKANLDVSLKVNVAIGLREFGLDTGKEKELKDGVRLLNNLLEDSQSLVRFHAALALGSVGPDAKVAIPRLIAHSKEYSTWEVRKASVMALGSVAAPSDSKTFAPLPVFRALQHALNDKSHQVRLEAALALIRL